MPRKPPNIWTIFTQRVENLLRMNTLTQANLKTLSKQFASILKDEKPYDQWTDEEILERFKTWDNHYMPIIEREVTMLHETSGFRPRYSSIE
jgi:hypothetical protein